MRTITIILGLLPQGIIVEAAIRPRQPLPSWTPNPWFLATGAVSAWRHDQTGAGAGRVRGWRSI